jgi:NAD(P)-dependent dehydrogenase (short-subunit alcohol dehydrogenase family)
MRLKGKTALVTAAGQGIGQAAALAMAAEGATIVIGDMDETSGKKAADELGLTRASLYRRMEKYGI